MTHVNFPDGLPEEDEGTFRIAAASNGLVPLFKNLSESKVKKMLEEAESKLSAKELVEYKLNWPIGWKSVLWKIVPRTVRVLMNTKMPA